jgi:electron transfer flavoprotein alpha subunit
MIAPGLYILLGASGQHNHMIATRGAGLVVAVNRDPDAPVFDAADIGVIADWAEVAPLLAAELATRLREAVPSTRQPA